MGFKLLWSGRRMIFGVIPTFTTYRFYADRIIIRQGVLNTRESEIQTARIRDQELHRSFWEILFNLGTVKVISTDPMDPYKDIGSVKEPEKLLKLLRKTTKYYQDHRVSQIEIYGGPGFGGYGGNHG